jgi:hypothetical protein
MSNTWIFTSQNRGPGPQQRVTGAMQLIQSWFVDKMLNVNTTQVRKAVRAKRNGNIKTEQLVAINTMSWLLHLTQYRINILSCSSDAWDIPRK